MSYWVRTMFPLNRKHSEQKVFCFIFQTTKLTVLLSGLNCVICTCLMCASLPIFSFSKCILEKQSDCVSNPPHSSSLHLRVYFTCGLSITANDIKMEIKSWGSVTLCNQIDPETKVTDWLPESTVWSRKKSAPAMLHRTALHVRPWSSNDRCCCALLHKVQKIPISSVNNDSE